LPVTLRANLFVGIPYQTVRCLLASSNPILISCEQEIATAEMRWEYMVREFDVRDAARLVLLEEFLNEVGRDGWELVSVARTPTETFTHLVYLKRPTAATEVLDLA